MNEQDKDLATGIITTLFIVVILIGVYGIFQLYVLQKQIAVALERCPCLTGDVVTNATYYGVVETCNRTITGRYVPGFYYG